MQHIGELAVWPEGPRDIMLVGGCSEYDRTQTIEKIEIGEEGTILNSQFLLPELPFKIIGYSAVTLGTIGTYESKGLLIGGLFRFLEKNGEVEYQKTIEFELSTKNWDTNRPKTNHERWFSSSSTLPDGSPAICGGGGMSPMKSTEIRGEDGEWNLSRTAVLRLGRSYHRTTVVNGSMFAIGGYTDNGTTNTVEIWDPRDKSGWNNSSVPSMIEKRDFHSVSSVDDSIFVFGGYSGDYLVSLCESLDVRSNKWNPLSSIPLKRTSHSSIVVGDQILIIGGYKETTQIDSYNPPTDTWKVLKNKLIQPRSFFQAFAL
jgi:hypothetical protein